ncbi:MAG: carbohydrate kinase [Terriglobales bacterium]|jgi:fructokinase
MKKLVVGLGEVLWDILPGRKYLGGAPANFAYMTNLMGDHGIVASRVGTDARGLEAMRRIEVLGLTVEAVQRDGSYPTGAVNVHVDDRGMARFEIEEPSAWDFLEWTPEWHTLAQKADAVCFGSLAQRAAESRNSIRRFVRATRPAAVRVFDVNLRPPFYSQSVLEESMKLADIVKLNDDEVPKVMELGNLAHIDEKSSAKRLIDLYDLKLVCITRGSRGSLLVSPSDASEQAGFAVRVADTIGAGDAFTAALVHEYLREATLDRMNHVANLVGAWVASESGPTPTPKDGALERSLAEIV